MQCDVLLAYPKERFVIFEDMIPHGLATIAAVLESDGLQVRIVDFTNYRGDFRKDLHRWNPRVIGIGGTTATRTGSFRIARVAKEELPEVPTVYGGVHASFSAEDTLSHIPSIDYVIRGEGEHSFAAFCSLVLRGISPTSGKIDGLSFREDGRIVSHPAKRIDDLDSLPLPARHLFEADHYRQTLDFTSEEADFLITSRGCPSSCNFCSASRMFPGGPRTRSAGHIRDEIESILSRKKIGGLKLFDSTFTVSKEHVSNFCSMVRPYGLLWECEIRADGVDRDLLACMKDAGCYYINVGLETSDPDLLQTINKGITPGQVERVLDWCRELDIRSKVFFSFGHLGQTFRDCLHDAAYLRRNRKRIDFFACNIGVRVYPGTALEAAARKQGLIPPTLSWSSFKPSLLNYLLLEPGDTLILQQKRLGHGRLILLLAILIAQGTVTPGSYIWKLLQLNMRRLKSKAGRLIKRRSTGLRRSHIDNTLQ